MLPPGIEIARDGLILPRASQRLSVLKDMPIRAAARLVLYAFFIIVCLSDSKGH